MRKFITGLTAALIFIIISASAGAEQTPAQLFDTKIKKLSESIETITPKELMKWIKRDKDFTLLDVREQNETEAGIIDIPNYMHIPRGLLEVMAVRGALKQDDTIVIFCKKGARSILASAALQELGFRHIYHLEGGIHGWMESGYPITNSLGTFKAVPYELTECGDLN